MPYETDEKLKSFLGTNQTHKEQMCLAILSIDKRFTDVKPRHPHGGKDGGWDIEAIYKENKIAFGAVGFTNQANDSKEQKKSIKKKFEADLKTITSSLSKPSVFVFFTNINLTITEKKNLILKSNKEGILFCEIFDRERLRIVLDMPDGFFIRFQYLQISLSEDEQASFFARWGDDIQSVISTGFQKIENTLNRVLFLQEASNPLAHLTLVVELDKNYSAEEIGHFRLFCNMSLMEPINNVFSILFGSTCRLNQIKNESEIISEENSVAKFDISGGQWEQKFKDKKDNDTSQILESKKEEDDKYISVGSFSSVGVDSIELLSISYNSVCFFRIPPYLSLRDIDGAMFLPYVNKTLAKKIKAIHIFSNGYKLQEISLTDFNIEETKEESWIPVSFSEDELLDPWVKIRPNKSSAFHISFFSETPKRMSMPRQTKNSLENRK